MKRLTIILIIMMAGCIFFLASVIFVQFLSPNASNITLAPSPKAVVTMPVYPQEAARLPVTTLANLVAAAIPAQGFSRLGWGYMIANPMVRWTTNGVESTGSTSLREGLVRVRVAGKLATTIRRTRDELAWTLTLGSYGPEKFGPKWISIEVGPPGDQCFGTLDSGCTFTPAQALAAPDLVTRRICGKPGQDKKVFYVKAPGKKAALVIYVRSEGSGGSSSWLEIRPLSDQRDVCLASNSND